MGILMRVSSCALVVSALASTALAQTPAFDPRDWKTLLASQSTQVMTLGNPHLSQIATKVNDALMADVLNKLAAFHPDFITVEAVSGEQCDFLKRYASVYPGSYNAWCPLPDIAQKAIGMDGPTAESELEKLLAASPTPAAAQRRRLAALFLATGTPLQLACSG